MGRKQAIYKKAKKLPKNSVGKSVIKSGKPKENSDTKKENQFLFKNQENETKVPESDGKVRKRKYLTKKKRALVYANAMQIEEQQENTDDVKEKPKNYSKSTFSFEKVEKIVASTEYLDLLKDVAKFNKTMNVDRVERFNHANRMVHVPQRADHLITEKYRQVGNRVDQHFSYPSMRWRKIQKPSTTISSRSSPFSYNNSSDQFEMFRIESNNSSNDCDSFETNLPFSMSTQFNAFTPMNCHKSDNYINYFTYGIVRGKRGPGRPRSKGLLRPPPTPITLSSGYGAHPLWYSDLTLNTISNPYVPHIVASYNMAKRIGRGGTRLRGRGRGMRGRGGKIISGQSRYFNEMKLFNEPPPFETVNAAAAAATATATTITMPIGEKETKEKHEQEERKDKKQLILKDFFCEQQQKSNSKKLGWQQLSHSHQIKNFQHEEEEEEEELKEIEVLPKFYNESLKIEPIELLMNEFEACQSEFKDNQITNLENIKPEFLKISLNEYKQNQNLFKQQTEVTKGKKTNDTEHKILEIHAPGCIANDCEFELVDNVEVGNDDEDIDVVNYFEEKYGHEVLDLEENEIILDHETGLMNRSWPVVDDEIAQDVFENAIHFKFEETGEE